MKVLTSRFYENQTNHVNAEQQESVISCKCNKVSSDGTNADTEHNWDQTDDSMELQSVSELHQRVQVLTGSFYEKGFIILKKITVTSLHLPVWTPSIPSPAPSTTVSHIPAPKLCSQLDTNVHTHVHQQKEKTTAKKWGIKKSRVQIWQQIIFTVIYRHIQSL